MKSNLYPDAPGWKARETSKEAAKKVRNMARSLRARVYDAIKEKSGTPEQIAERLEVDVMNVRPRCSELVAGGYIEPCGVGLARGGGQATVWRVVTTNRP